jgi:hypothetical protein
LLSILKIQSLKSGAICDAQLILVSIAMQVRESMTTVASHALTESCGRRRQLSASKSRRQDNDGRRWGLRLFDIMGYFLIN